MLLERPIKKSAQKALEEKQTATMSLTKVWLCNDYSQSEPFSVKCSIWWACKQTDSPASDQRQVTVKNLHRSFRNREAIYFRTREDYNGNFLDGLERRKLQKKVQISHLFDGRHFFSWRGSGLEKSLASVNHRFSISTDRNAECFFPELLVLEVDLTFRFRLHGSRQIFAGTKTCTVLLCVYTRPAELDEFLNG